MRMENLKSIMGVDTEDIVKESVDLLTSREWDVTPLGVKTNLETSLFNKDKKLLAFRENPYYNGNLQLVMPMRVRRNTSFIDAKGCINEMIDGVYNEPRDITPDGKCASDFIKEAPGKKWVTVNEIEIINATQAITKTLFEKFDRNCLSYESKQLFNRMENALDTIKCNMDERISEFVANRLNEIFELEKKKFVAGQKTSKVVNRILNMSRNYQEYYNDLFTRFGNYVNSYETDGYFVVSLNFLDYLRMSDGVSWSSCHTTDWKNTRRLPNSYHGAFVQGSLSYANDGVSMVAYIIEAKGADATHPDRTYKINRCMFHVSDDFKQIIQGRVYPNGREDSSCMGIYDMYFDNFLKIMGLNKDDYHYVGRACDDAIINTCGANYQDYFEYSDPRLFLADGKENARMFIGYEAYSCNTGEELDGDAHDTIV